MLSVPSSQVTPTIEDEGFHCTKSKNYQVRYMPSGVGLSASRQGSSPHDLIPDSSRCNGEGHGMCCSFEVFGRNL